MPVMPQLECTIQSKRKKDCVGKFEKVSNHVKKKIIPMLQNFTSTNIL